MNHIEKPFYKSSLPNLCEGLPTNRSERRKPGSLNRRTSVLSVEEYAHDANWKC